VELAANGLSAQTPMLTSRGNIKIHGSNQIGDLFVDAVAFPGPETLFGQPVHCFTKYY